MKPAIPIFILDLAPILKGGTPAEAFRNTLDLARHAEKWGYRRYWLAEHRGMPGVASAATWCNRVGRKRLPQAAKTIDSYNPDARHLLIGAPAGDAIRFL